MMVNLTSNASGLEVKTGSTDVCIVSEANYTYIVSVLIPFARTFNKFSIIADILSRLNSIPIETFIEHLEMVYCLLLKNCPSLFSVNSSSVTGQYFTLSYFLSHERKIGIKHKNQSLIF